MHSCWISIHIAKKHTRFDWHDFAASVFNLSREDPKVVDRGAAHLKRIYDTMENAARLDDLIRDGIDGLLASYPNSAEAESAVEYDSDESQDEASDDGTPAARNCTFDSPYDSA